MEISWPQNLGHSNFPSRHTCNLKARSTYVWINVKGWVINKTKKWNKMYICLLISCTVFIWVYTILKASLNDISYLFYVIIIVEVTNLNFSIWKNERERSNADFSPFRCWNFKVNVIILFRSNSSFVQVLRTLIKFWKLCNSHKYSQTM